MQDRVAIGVFGQALTLIDGPCEGGQRQALLHERSVVMLGEGRPW